MKPFTLEIEIAMPVPEVFNFIADSENAPLWYEAVSEAHKLTPGPIRPGTLYQMSRALPHGTVVNEVETIEFETNHLLTLKSLRGPTPFTYRYTLTPSLHGTHLTLEGTISGQGLTGPSALLAPLAQALFKRGMTSNLCNLKHHFEDHSRSTPCATAGTPLNETARRHCRTREVDVGSNVAAAQIESRASDAQLPGSRGQSRKGAS